MAIRNVNTEFWSDPKITDEFTHYDKYFWLFLLTTRYGNLSGCFELSMKQMQYDLGLPVEKVKELITRFIGYELIDYDENTNEILLINYHKHNWSKSPKFICSVEKYANKIKNEYFKDYIFNVLTKNGEEIGYGYGMDTVSIPYKVKDKDKDNNIIVKNIKDKDKTKTKDKELINNRIIKQPYGEFGNVLLTNDEYQALRDLFTEHFRKYIIDLDLYIGSSGKKYKSHYAVIRQWLNRDNIDPEKLECVTLGKKPKGEENE